MVNKGANRAASDAGLTGAMIVLPQGVAIVTGPLIETVHLPDDLQELSIRTFRRKNGKIPSLEEQEKDYIRWVLQEANGNQTVAARDPRHRPGLAVAQAQAL